MRRGLIGLAVTALAVLAFAAPASAASSHVFRFSFHGSFADAFWSTSTATSFTDTTVSASKSANGSQLLVDQFTGNVDANGNFLGGTDTSADVTTGFSFLIDKAQLTTGSTSGLGLPGTTCTIDANGNIISCSPTTIDVTVAWTGQGPITRGVANDHFKSAGFSVNDHFNGTDRAAGAAGTFAGNALNASDLQFADLGFTNSGTITRCFGIGC
jgi:hypothetical protein